MYKTFITAGIAASVAAVPLSSQQVTLVQEAGKALENMTGKKMQVLMAQT